MRFTQLMVFFLLAISFALLPLGLRAEYNANYKLDITNIHTTDEDRLTYITGTITNKSAKIYSGMQIVFDLIDEDGNVVTQTMDSIMNFKPGSKWKFKCLITDDSAKNFRMSDIEVIE